MKADSSVVSNPTWITLNSHQTAPSLAIFSTNASHEGIYLVTVISKLYNESAFSPEFTFELYLHPSPCIHTVLNPNGTTLVPDMSY